MFSKFVKSYLNPKLIIPLIAINEEILLYRLGGGGQAKLESSEKIRLSVIVRTEQCYEGQTFHLQVADAAVVMDS